MPVKFVFVTGGVVSGLGKGITAASIGRLLKARGLKVTMQKLDPYININPGRMSPIQHGEVFVTDDGAETDLDIGHYERFTDESLTTAANATSGKIYWNVLTKERAGDYGGGTVQIIPHITNEIKSRIYSSANTPGTDVVIVEIGGTVGDMESMPFLEAIRQVASDVGRENCLYVHVALIPYLSASNEIKTKPVQHSVKELLSIGIQPDLVVCRTQKTLDDGVKAKLGLFCNIDKRAVIQNINVDTIYEIPLIFEEEGLTDIVCEKLRLQCGKPDLTEWTQLVKTFKAPKYETTVAIVGKDARLHDAYLSVYESLLHAGISNNSRVHIRWIDAHDLTPDNASELLSGVDGIVSPGGYEPDGAAGQLAVTTYARENDIPFFAIGLGMQLAVIEYARNVCGIADADTEEFDKHATKVVYLPEGREAFAGISLGREQDIRKGAFHTILNPDSFVYTIYGSKTVSERHWHQYEINPAYVQTLTEAGLTVSGVSEAEGYADVIELRKNRWFVGVIFHPQFKSRPNRAHPLFDSFVRACINKA